jgi:hypothetical protein
MADTRTGSLHFFRWTSSIALMAAVSVLIFHFTRPATPKEIAPTEFDGFVADAATRQLLRDASVTVSLGNYSAQTKTDTFGRYSLVFPSPNPNASTATVLVNTPGYKPASNQISLHPGSNYAEITLSTRLYTSIAEVSPPPSSETAGLRPVAASTDSAPPTGRAEIVLKNLPSDFMRASATHAVAANK